MKTFYVVSLVVLWVAVGLSGHRFHLKQLAKCGKSDFMMTVNQRVAEDMKRSVVANTLAAMLGPFIALTFIKPCS